MEWKKLIGKKLKREKVTSEDWNEKKKVFLDYGAQKTRPLTNISDILF